MIKKKTWAIPQISIRVLVPMKKTITKFNESQVAIYKTSDGQTRIDVRFAGDTVWLTQKQMADVFDKDTDTIGLHIKNIYQTGELMPAATTEKYSVVQKEGQRLVDRPTIYYNLDVVISVGYRVNSKRGTQFRIWATARLRQHLLSGYTVNKELLAKNREKFLAMQK
ncbi:MAG: RhuM family protein, partial [bacterium]|nr:RhuM family protein [bacterium]